MHASAGGGDGGGGGGDDFPRTDPDLSRTDPDFSRTDPDFSRTDPDFSRTDPEFSRIDPGFSRIDPSDKIGKVFLQKLGSDLVVQSSRECYPAQNFAGTYRTFIHSLRAMRLQDRALGPWVGRQIRCAMCRHYTNVFIPHGGSKVCHFLCFSSAPLQVDLMTSKENQASHRPMAVPPRQYTHTNTTRMKAGS